MAEGRGKAQAATLRKMRTTTMARLLLKDGEDAVAASELKKGDLVVCEANDARAQREIGRHELRRVVDALDDVAVPVGLHDDVAAGTFSAVFHE